MATANGAQQGDLSQSPGRNGKTAPSEKAITTLKAHSRILGRTQTHRLEKENSLTMTPSTETKQPVVNGLVASITEDQASQPLTHYHSRLYSLLSWERPAATASSFISVVLFIVASRYLPLIRWALKFLYLALGVTASAEIGSRVVFSRGLNRSSEPRKYYTIPKDTIESFLEDIENLVDFCLIEFQRILFVENLPFTIAAFVTALASYWLVMFLPLWGLALLATCVVYLAPLIYITNKEFIDTQLGNVQELLTSQASQMKEMAETQTAHATGIVKQYVGDYRAKANDYIGSSSAPAPKSAAKAHNPTTSTPTRLASAPAPVPAKAPAPKSAPEAASETAINDTEPGASMTEATESVKPLDKLPDLEQVAHVEFPEAPKGEPKGPVKEEDKIPDLIQTA